MRVRRWMLGRLHRHAIAQYPQPDIKERCRGPWLPRQLARGQRDTRLDAESVWVIALAQALAHERAVNSMACHARVPRVAWRSAPKTPIAIAHMWSEVSAIGGRHDARL